MSSNPILKALEAAGARPGTNAAQKEKKNYAERFSRALAQLTADALRRRFKGILPDAAGRHQESKARSSRGMKKLDVNYSTVELGLGLGISIKTITHPDPRTKRFNKNYTRIDNELRAEAADYHERQPYSVLIALVFIPLAACDDATKNAPSSFGTAVRSLRPRNHRKQPEQKAELFEKIFVGLFEPEGADAGACSFFDVECAPPRAGRPAPRTLRTFDELLLAIEATYDERNSPPFTWADAPAAQGS